MGKHPQRGASRHRARRDREILYGKPPPILDPFAGGGSIPLEAQRLGLDACARDLNPVAVLINKALIEIPPKWAGRSPIFPDAADEAMAWPRATGLAEDVLRYGRWMRDEAQKRIGKLYPKVTVDGAEATVIAWIWARTITCPNPACRSTMPLAGSFCWVRSLANSATSIPYARALGCDLRSVDPMASPSGHSFRGRSHLLVLRCAVEPNYVKDEGRADRMGAQLMVIVAQGDRRRHYLPPDGFHESAATVSCPDNLPAGNLEKDPRNLWCADMG